jgi:peroxiredoxin
MKTQLLTALAILSLLLPAQGGVAAEKGAAADELKDLVTKVNAKLEQGKKTQADLAPELKEFDALRAKHKGEKTDEVAQIQLMEAMLYLQVLDNTDKGVELIKQLKRDFPDTKPAQNADRILDSLKKQEEAKKLQATLAEGTKFPEFNEKDTAGKPLSIANYKGKVVLLDFWATWCGPCVRELPNVIKTYDAYHKKGFEIIGISLDKDQQKLASFTKEKNMTWPQYFDGLGWQNKLAVKYGVSSIPATYLLDGQGTIIGKDLRGEDLEQAVAKALAKK